MAVDHGDGQQETNRVVRRIRRLETASPLKSSPSGDSGHAGSGANSVQLGPDADASGDDSVAVGNFPVVSGSESVGVGPSCYITGTRSGGFGAYSTSEHDNSFAIGNNVGTSADWQIRLGTAFHTVYVAGTFTNPSARRLKQNIIPAPEIDGLFPSLHEYEYRANPGVRRLGYIADDMVGTSAERFVQFNDDGDVEGVAYVDLHTAQIAALLARIERLEDELRNRNG